MNKNGAIFAEKKRTLSIPKRKEKKMSYTKLERDRARRVGPFGGSNWMYPFVKAENTTLLPASDKASGHWGGGWRNFFGSCMATFVGVTVFIVLLGFAATTFSSVCTIAEDGTCSAGCDCVKVDIEKTDAGTYREYSKIDIVALMLIVGVLRFSADMFMSRFSTGTLDWITTVALVIKNYLIGDHVNYYTTFLGESLGHILGGLVGVLILWGWNEDVDAIAFAELTRHSSGDRIFRAYMSLTMIVFVGTLTLLWSRYKYMYSDLAHHLRGSNKSDIIKSETTIDMMGNGTTYASVKFMPLWPEIKHQIEHASINAIAWTALTGTTCLYVGPAPLIFWQTFFAMCLRGFTSSVTDNYYGLFLGFPFLRLVVPFFMWLVLWSLKGLPSDTWMKKE